MKEQHYDVVHVHGNSGTIFIEIHAAKQAHVPIRIAHCHSTSCKYRLVHRFMKPFLNRELTCAVACSDLAGQWLFTRDFYILPNGIDMPKFAYSQAIRDSYREELHLNGKKVIGHVGYMDTEKNQLFLLRVFKKIVEQDSNVRLLLIGDGRMRPEIEQYISENHLDEYVLLLGRRTDVANLYQCMDVFVLPSLFEGLPVSLVEAQTAGLPCFVSNTVTRQVDLVGNIQYLGIEDTEPWVKALIESMPLLKEREFYVDRMMETPFNIQKSAQELLRIYQN